MSGGLFFGSLFIRDFVEFFLRVEDVPLNDLSLIPGGDSFARLYVPDLLDVLSAVRIFSDYFIMEGAWVSRYLVMMFDDDLFLF